MHIAFLLIGVLLLMWLVMSAPVGIRTIKRTFRVHAPAEKIRAALHPFGSDFTWNGAVSAVEKYSADSGKMITSHADRKGSFIERDFALYQSDNDLEWMVWFTSDTSLDQSFWRHHRMETKLLAVSPHETEVQISETDSYNGIAFLIFRYFSMRRMALKLKIWGEKGTYQSGGLFERPSTQIVMAMLSALLLWPVFGLTGQGFLLSAALTLIVGLHELGHIAAFRIMGHRTARMIFIPILGGIALGGRPYDRHFEIGFSALMGAGFSAFLTALLMWSHPLISEMSTKLIADCVVVFALMGALFNLGNLIPVWKFDGGQVLRQIFRTPYAQALCAFLLLGWLMAIGHIIGLPANMLIISGAIFSLLSVFTSKGGIKPKTPLTPMNNNERAAILAAFVAVFSIHCSVLVWSAGILFA
ncbi:hypothetical protein [Ahrensia sp. 13_GOM-1096m]|uniref:hypothetical protein n=1 Tax=Ahrensia sp. 13_GOM-1096m TaxID=1380380 RepID=UPI000478E6C7|nr:hypothetical protein [Ahrensia sp. 13_GOM-1096m]